MDTNEAIRKLQQIKQVKKESDANNQTNIFAKSLTNFKNIIVGAMSDLTGLVIANEPKVTVKNFPKSTTINNKKLSVEVSNFPKDKDVQRVEVTNQEKTVFETKEITDQLKQISVETSKVAPAMRTSILGQKNAIASFSDYLKDIISAIKNIKLSPNITVKPADVKVEAPIVNVKETKIPPFPKKITADVDMSALEDKIDELITETQYQTKVPITVANPGDFPVSTTNTKDLAKEDKQDDIITAIGGIAGSLEDLPVRGTSDGDDTTPIFIRATEHTHRLYVDASISEDTATPVDVDDNNIAKSQVLPLEINENYIFSKTEDAWVRRTGTDDGFAFNTTIGLYGIYTPLGDTVLDETANHMKSGIYGKTSDTTFQVPRIDTSTHSLQIIDYPHHEVHAGKFYRSGMNYTLANGEVATFSITTPNTTEWCHITWELTATADGTFTLLEDVTSFAGGAAVTPINHNRNSLTASTMTCLRGMTGANLITPTGGTTILNAVLGTGKGSSTQRGVGEEFILKQNSKYLFRYTNGTSANIIQLACEWYEHTNKTA